MAYHARPLKITDEQVAELRKQYCKPRSENRPTLAQLAKEYGLTSGYVSAIIWCESRQTMSKEEKHAYLAKLREFNPAPKENWRKW